MTGKIVLVTGATAGIGRATAEGLAALGATVLVGARNHDKASAAAAAITESTGNPNVGVAVADLASPHEVRALAADVRRRHDRLDVVVNNAAVIPKRREITAGGIEVQLAVNHLAPFLLTRELLSLLSETGGARVVNVSSVGHRRGRIDFDDLGAERRYGVYGLRQYFNTKLMNLLFTYELARRAPEVATNALHPGVIGTRIARQIPLGSLTRFLFGGPRRGAATSIYLASSEEVAGVSGQYFENRRPRPSSALSYDEALAGALWERSLELISTDP